MERGGRDAQESDAPLPVAGRSTTCTFYVEGGLFEPWTEKLPEPPQVGHQLDRRGFRFTVTRSTRSDWPGSEPEASIWLTPGGTSAPTT